MTTMKPQAKPNSFIAIRKRSHNNYVVEFGAKNEPHLLNSRQGFKSIDEAIEWVEKFDDIVDCMPETIINNNDQFYAQRKIA